MPQIFQRSANTLSKLSLFGLVSLVGGLILLALVLARSSYVTRANEFVEQPIQFLRLVIRDAERRPIHRIVSEVDNDGVIILVADLDADPAPC